LENTVALLPLIQKSDNNYFSNLNLLHAKYFLLLIALFSCNGLWAQKKNEAFQLSIKSATSPINIDGIMDEAAWIEANVASDFFMVLPMDTSMARVRTEVRMTYDDQNLYLIATCFHLLPGRYFVESLRRDFAFGKNDNFLLFMDTFDDQTNGFSLARMLQGHNGTE
jgi:hypothetical protein